MASKKPRKRKPQKRSRKTPGVAEMLSDIVSRPSAATDEAMMVAADHYDQALAALDAGDFETAMQALRDALDRNPRDVDSLALLAEMASENDAQRVEALRIVENVARDELGEQAFSEDRGYFWGLVETRPFMRIKARLVGLLRESGELDNAIEECEEMLALNPGDNQGMRYGLMGMYLEAARTDKAKDLLAQYDEEESAFFAWGRVLLCLLEDRLDEAKESLQRAQEINVFVSPLLLGVLGMPDNLPDSYTPGGPSEAVMATDALLAGWLRDDAAPLRWLAQHVPI